MTEELLSGDVLLSGYSGKLRVARDSKGDLKYRTETRKTQAPSEREWEVVIDDWSSGMGLARLPAGQRYTKRYYYSKNFDATVSGILRPRQRTEPLPTTHDWRRLLGGTFRSSNPVAKSIYSSLRIARLQIPGGNRLDLPTSNSSCVCRSAKVSITHQL